MDFVIGQEYRRGDLHLQFGGSRQGGISPSRRFPLAFLITSPAGKEHGYQYDRFEADGTFSYTGEGQVGDMTFVRGNRVIRDAENDGRELHLFQESRRGFLRYMGRVECLGSHYAPAPDRLGAIRRAIVFELALESSENAIPPAVVSTPNERAPRNLWTQPMAELRKAAIAAPPAGAPVGMRKANVYRRSEAVKVYVLRRAAGVCEACGKHAPFQTNDGRAYLEPHHIARLADGGPDHPKSVAALCPNCHKEIHHGVDGAKVNADVANRIGALEAD